MSPEIEKEIRGYDRLLLRLALGRFWFWLWSRTKVRINQTSGDESTVLGGDDDTASIASFAIDLFETPNLFDRVWSKQMTRLRRVSQGKSSVPLLYLSTEWKTNGPYLFTRPLISLIQILHPALHPQSMGRIDTINTQLAGVDGLDEPARCRLTIGVDLTLQKLGDPLVLHTSLSLNSRTSLATGIRTSTKKARLTLKIPEDMVRVRTRLPVEDAMLGGTLQSTGQGLANVDMHFTVLGVHGLRDVEGDGRHRDCFANEPADSLLFEAEADL